MATLITTKQKQQCTVKIEIKQATSYISIRTQTKQQEQQQQEEKHHYCNQQKQQHKDIFKHFYKKDVDDFYHIKQLYFSNQRSNFIHNDSTTSPTQPTAATTSTLSYVLHSLSYNSRSFVTMLLVGYLLLVQYAMAAPQSCILCDKNDLLAKDPQNNFEEFLFEHQVTKQDAINALRQLNESFYEGTASDSSCNGVRCTEKVMRYCLGSQFINDHCWCEVGHSTEGLPFVPHICYVGEKIYKTSVGSCFFYEEVKDCCCSSVLAKEWRHISAGSSIYSKTMFRNKYSSVIIFLIYHLICGLFN